MSDPVQNVINEGAELAQLRQRLAELDAERAKLQTQINACMQRIAATTAREAPPPANGPLVHRILYVLRSNRAFTLAPMDIAQHLGLVRVADLENIRVHLSRMCQKGWIRRVSHGRYQSLD